MSKVPIYHVGLKAYRGVNNLIVSQIVPLVCEVSLNNIDALIITSANALLALDKITQKWRRIPAFVIGERSAQVVRDYGGVVEFISHDSHGDMFFNEVKEHLIGRAVFYPRAKEIVSRLGERLMHVGVNLTEAIVYENRPLELKPEQKPPKGAILIFTAPSAYRHFLESFLWDDSYEAIAIGRTTLQCFAPAVRAHIAPCVSFESCLQKAHELQKKLS